MKKSIPGYVKIGIGIALVLFTFIYAWLHMQFPVYKERQVTQTIERNIPIGASREQVIKFLNTLKTNDVYYEILDSNIAAYFPETMFWLRGWRCVEVIFIFKNGNMENYTMKHVNI